MTLERDTALKPLGEARWSARLAGRWWHAGGPFGGYLSALLMRAMLAAVDDAALPPRGLTVHFLEPPSTGEVTVSAKVERAAPAATTVSLRMEQHDRPVLLALGHAGAWRVGEPEWREVAPPAVPPPEDCFPAPPDTVAPFRRNLSVRLIADQGPAGDARVPSALWVGAKQLDHLGATLLADSLWPAAFARLGRIAFVPTLDLTIHFRASLPAAAPDDWLLAVSSSSVAAGGTWQEDLELWTLDGTLLVQSRQLALIRELRDVNCHA